MTTSPRVVFFGNERLVSGLGHTDCPLLSGLIAHGYTVVAVVVNHHDTSSRTKRPLEVAQIAAQHNIPVLSPQRPVDIEQELRDLSADFAVLSAYGRIIPSRIINVFSPIGIINIHPSLLPRHRGSTPIETTILAGDHTAGVSIMQLAPGMDDGPLYAQSDISLTGNETKFELYEQLSRLGSETLFKILPDVISGILLPKSQPIDGVSYTTTISKSDGSIDPASETASEIERKVRAYLVYPKSKLRFRDKDVIITSSKVIDRPLPNQLCVPCKENSTLLVESLIAPNGKHMSGEAYLRGLANRAKDR
ncbi:MAG: methionyl-tRNA formyltransferase [Candidatus Saccharimonadales bacterium]